MTNREKEIMSCTKDECKITLAEFLNIFWRNKNDELIIYDNEDYEILKYNEEEDKFFDPNKPYKPFFEPNYLNLLKLKRANFEQNQINELWGAFLEKGNQKLINETDDKSMILSVYLISLMNEAES